MQALHYLTLSLLIPPLLWCFAEPNALIYEGGAANVGEYGLPKHMKLDTHHIVQMSGMVMDWREMAGWPTVHGLRGDDRRGWSHFRGAYSGGRKIGTGTWIDPFKDGNLYQWDGRTDPLRGWVIAFCWIIASFAEYVFLFANFYIRA